MAKKKNKGGAPTKYKEEYNNQTYELCLLGYTTDMLANFFNVASSTIELWKRTHEGFSGAVTRGGDMADGKAARAFYGRVLGYDYIETKEKQGDNGCETITTTKHVPADAGAAMNWLSNRKPKIWRKDPKVKVEIKVGDVSDEELQKKIDKLEGK